MIYLLASATCGLRATRGNRTYRYRTRIELLTTMPSSKTRTLKVNAHVIGCVKRYLNKKGVIIEVVTEGTKTQFLVRFDEVSNFIARARVLVTFFS